MELQSQNQYSLAFTYICIIFSKCKSIVPIFPEQFKTVSIFICVQLKLIVVVVGAASISVLVILHSLLFVLNRIGSLHCIYIYILLRITTYPIVTAYMRLNGATLQLFNDIT